MLHRVLPALALGIAGSSLPLAAAAGPAAVNPKVHVAPSADYKEQWFTTQDNCTYSRTSAPGYGTQWYLVLNPHHVGKPNAHGKCPTRLKGS